MASIKNETVPISVFFDTDREYTSEEASSVINQFVISLRTPLDVNCFEFASPVTGYPIHVLTRLFHKTPQNANNHELAKALLNHSHFSPFETGLLVLQDMRRLCEFNSAFRALSFILCNISVSTLTGCGEYCLFGDTCNLLDAVMLAYINEQFDSLSIFDDVYGLDSNGINLDNKCLCCRFDASQYKPYTAMFAYSYGQRHKRQQLLAEWREDRIAKALRYDSIRSMCLAQHCYHVFIPKPLRDIIESYLPHVLITNACMPTRSDVYTYYDEMEEVD